MDNKLINKNQTIFVAGHNGMVGSALCKILKIKGYDKLITVTRKDLDLRDNVSVKKWFEINKPRVVIIAAAKVGGIWANNSYPTEFLLDNLKIQMNIIENAYKYKADRLLFLGSSCIYPKFSKQPIKEEYLLDGKLEETNEQYALAKISGIKLCNALKAQYGFDAFSVMPTNLYGPGDNYHPTNSHVIPSLIRKFCEAKQLLNPKVHCWGDGSPMREFLHVDDLANACIFALEEFVSCENDINFLNIGSDCELSIKDLALMISNIIGYKGDIEWDQSKPNGTPRKKLDCSRIYNLGWKPKIDLKDGLRSTILEYLEGKSY